MNTSQLTIAKTPLTPEEEKTIVHDLQFISQITQTAKTLGYRIIISGGYGVDGALGTLTRPHDDIDIGIYGSKPAEESVKEILRALDPSLLSLLEDEGRKEYWHYFHLKKPVTLAELYFLRVATDPFANEKIIIKENGDHADVQFYDTQQAVLEGITFEIQNPVTELADKIYKREFRGDPKKSKHEQDIENLRLITNPREVELEFEKLMLRDSEMSSR